MGTKCHLQVGEETVPDTFDLPGPGGFGGPTPWRTSDIWLRQEFDLGGLGADDLQNLAFTCCHDEDCEIYLNGVLASRAPGCTTTYVLIAMNEEARRVLHPNGKALFQNKFSTLIYY